MYTHDELIAYAQKFGASPSSICEHVANGASVKAFGNGGICWFAGCSEECLYTEDRSTYRTDHLIDKQPELAVLLHLPIYGLAKLNDSDWILDIMNLEPDLSSFESFVHIACNKSTFADSKLEYFVASALNRFHEDFFESGARFFPIWSSKESLKSYLGKSFADRILTKVTSMSATEVLEQAELLEHNYVCLQEGPLQWQCIIINDSFDAEKNFQI